MREPSIHITKSEFKALLKVFGINRFPTDRFFLQASQKAINTRSINVTNHKTYKKVKNITLAATGDANLAANIVYSVQIKLKHKGVKKIDESNTRLWATCKKLAEVCNTFCNDFGFETRAGYIKYIETGFSRMDNLKNFLNRLVSMAQNITESYQASLEIADDTDPHRTSYIHDYYARTVAERTGLKVNYEAPETYVYFVRLREYLDKDNIDYEDWLDAQFEGLEWCNGLPMPEKLMGDKAKEYYTKFMFKNHKSGSTPKIQGSLWDKINDDD